MKTNLLTTIKSLALIFVLSSSINYVKAQDILVAEYKFETDQEGWTWQAYTNIGNPTTLPAGGRIGGLNWTGTGGSAGCIRHNAAFTSGIWFARSPGLTLTAGKEYYVKFGVRSSGYYASDNSRVQIRVGPSTAPITGTIVLPSQSLPPASGTTYQEYTSSSMYIPATTGTYYFRVGDYWNNGSSAIYYDGIRVYEVAPAASEWNGTADSDWNNANNWTPTGVPPADGVVILPTGALANEPSISGISPTVSDLTIETGRTLTINSNAAISVSGVLTNDGTATVNSGGALVQTATSTIAGTGTYNIRRQIPGSGSSFRFLGTPINDINANGITGVSATGADGGQIIPAANCNANFVASGSPYGNILELREIVPGAVISGCSQSLWFVKSAGTLQNARGYAIKANGGQTITFIGTQVNNGLKEVTGLVRQSGTVSDHISGPGVTRGWHLVANPYPSPIAIPVNFLTDQGFDAQIQLFNSATGTWYGTSAPVTIAVGQGFQIRKAVEELNPSTLSFTNDLRVADVGVTYYDANEYGDYRLKVKVSGNDFVDNTTLFFHENGTANFDSKYDINKMIGNSTNPALFTMAGIERMAYNGLPNLTEPINIPMTFYPGTSGTYTLDFSQIESLPSTATVYLEDKQTGIWTNVRTQGSYSFSSQTSDNIERFNIHFEPPVNIATEKESCRLNDGTITIVNPSNETWALSVENNGNEVYQNNVMQGEVSIINLSSGAYTLNFSNSSFNTTEEVVIEASSLVAADFVLSESAYYIYDIVTATVQNPVEGIVYDWYLNDIYVGMGVSTSFAVSDMGAYTLRLDAGKGNCKSSATSSFQVDGTTAINTIEKDDFLRAFPNPANEMLTIVWNDKAENYETMRVMDISGRTVQLIQMGGRTQGNQLQLDLTDIPEGMYLIALEGKDLRRTVKISVVK